MSVIQRFQELFSVYELGKYYDYQGAYYRVKHYGDDIYSLQKAVPGMCGEKTAHPSLKFHWSEQTISYQFYVDFEAQPLVMKSFTPEDLAFFDQVFEELVTAFEKVAQTITN